LRKTIFVGIGGFLGAISRYGIKDIHIYDYNGNFPLNTLIINLAGSFLLALILVGVSSIFMLREDMKTGLTVGMLGAFTTFSTFCRETVDLFSSNLYLIAFLYICLSIIGGLTAAWFGVSVAEKLAGENSNRNKFPQLDSDMDEMEPEEE
jgi:CrcB protein